jgi:hypothetical protein
VYIIFFEIYYELFHYILVEVNDLFRVIKKLLCILLVIIVVVVIVNSRDGAEICAA